MSYQLNNLGEGIENPKVDDLKTYVQKVTTLKDLWAEKRSNHIGIANKINVKRVSFVKWYKDVVRDAEDPSLPGTLHSCYSVWAQYPGTDHADWPGSTSEQRRSEMFLECANTTTWNDPTEVTFDRFYKNHRVGEVNSYVQYSTDDAGNDIGVGETMTLYITLGKNGV
jgi:hypothetical protein